MTAGTRSLTDLSIDEANLDMELSSQAAYYLMAAERAIKAEQAYNDYKLQVEQLEANLSQKARDDIKERGDKPTEKMTSDAMISMPDYTKAHGRLARLRTEKEVMKALKEAWYMRKDLLIQVAIKARCELEALAASAVKGEAA